MSEGARSECARSMRAVTGSLAEGRAGEKYLPVGGRVRKLSPHSTCFKVDSLLT